MASSARLEKRILAGVLDGAGVLRVDRALRPTQVVLAVNYHGTPASLAPQLARHFAFYREHFDSLGEVDLVRFLRGEKRLRRPGVVVTFDDGARDNALVAAPLLEAYGLTGWFMIPGRFLDEPEATQDAYFKEHIRPTPTLEHPEGQPARAMSWAGARTLAARGHVIACHTWSHRPLGASVPSDIVQAEVVLSRAKLEAKLDREVRSFCWVRGQVDDYSARAHRAVQASYDLAFMTMSHAVRPETSPHAIHRFNVEASFPLSVLRLQLSSLNERAFAERRRAVERAIRGEPGATDSV